MDLFSNTTDWKVELTPILEKYKLKKHPLNYHSLYQLLIMVVLSAQDSDENVNTIAPNFFTVFPNMESLANSKIENIIPLIHQVNSTKIKRIGYSTSQKLLKKTKTFL